MNATLAIAQRELIEKRFVLVAAAAFLLLALVMPFMPGVPPGQRASALVVGSLGLSAIFTLGLSAILGSSIIGREMSDGRLSFYFSKPAPSTSIWFGKLIAASALILACFVIIGVPALLAGGAAAVHDWANGPRDAVTIVGGILGASAALFLLTHVIGTFVRSRSAWFLFDFIAASVCGIAIWMLVRPLLLGFAVELTWRLGRILGVFAALAIIASGAWQIARGRTDRRRSHMELSRFLWASLGSGLLVMAAFVAWVVSAAPRDVSRPDFAQQSATDWAFIGGQAKNRMDYRANFLYNIDSGHFVRIPRMQAWWEARFSSDGNVACWLVPSGEGSDVWIARLDSPDPRPIQTRITMKHVHSVAISPDGTRFASIDDQGVLTVDDLRSGDSLGSARVPTGTGWYEVFLRPDLVLIYAFNNNEPIPPRPISIFEYDVARRKLTTTGEFPRSFPRFSRDRSRVLTLSGRDIQIRDPRSGALQQTIGGGFINAKFLQDGRIAAIDREQTTLSIFPNDASAPRVIPLPRMKLDSIYEPSSGPLVACSSRGCAIVDIVKGAVTRTEDGIRPVTYSTTGPRLLSFTHDGLVVWNPVTGEKRPIS